MKNYNKVLNIVLEDDDTPTGGKLNENETLGDFIAEAHLPLNIIYDLPELNRRLIECGIKPVKIYISRDD